MSVARVCCLFLAVVAVAGRADAQRLAPVTAEQRRIIDGIPNEELPNPSQFYFRSNEWRHDLLTSHIGGIGGAYVGVGSDQGYTMAAMMQAEWVFMVDYDPRIPWVHRVYGALLADSETPQALIDRFAPANAAATDAILRRALASDPALEDIMAHMARSRRPWHSYLRRVQATTHEGRGITWLADPELFNRVRALHQNGRVIARAGDVTGTQTLRGIGQAATRLGTKVRVIYFSNAEQFFNYTPDFITNIRSLPIDDRSVVVRTIRHRRIRNIDRGRWHYMVHQISDFLSRLDTGHYTRSFALVADLLAAGPPHLGREGVSTMNGTTGRITAERAAQEAAAGGGPTTRR